MKTIFIKLKKNPKKVYSTYPFIDVTSRRTTFPTFVSLGSLFFFLLLAQKKEAKKRAGKTECLRRFCHSHAHGNSAV